MEGGKWSTGDPEGAVTVGGPSWVESPEDQEAGGAVSPSGQEHEPLRSRAGGAGRDGRDLRGPTGVVGPPG